MSDAREKPKTTIEEMEAILNSGHQPDVVILPNGQITTKERGVSDAKETLEWAASLNELNNGGTKIATVGDAIREVLAELADCERDHPPEPEYLAWIKAGKPDGAENERLRAALADPGSHWCKELREENERLRAERDDARNYVAEVALGVSHYPHGCVRCENEALQAELKEAHQVHAEQYEAHRQDGLRIKAALAIGAETDKFPPVANHVILLGVVRRMVKALKGEEDV